MPRAHFLPLLLAAAAVLPLCALPDGKRHGGRHADDHRHAHADAGAALARTIDALSASGDYAGLCATAPTIAAYGNISVHMTMPPAGTINGRARLVATARILGGAYTLLPADASARALVHASLDDVPLRGVVLQPAAAPAVPPVFVLCPATAQARCANATRAAPGGRGGVLCDIGGVSKRYASPADAAAAVAGEFADAAAERIERLHLRPADSWRVRAARARPDSQCHRPAKRAAAAAARAGAPSRAAAAVDGAAAVSTAALASAHTTVAAPLLPVVAATSATSARELAFTLPAAVGMRRVLVWTISLTDLAAPWSGADVEYVVSNVVSNFTRSSLGALVFNVTSPCSAGYAATACVYAVSKSAAEITDHDALFTAASEAIANHADPSCAYTPASFDHAVLLQPTLPSTDYGGLGSVLGPQTWVIRQGGDADVSVINHEIGHNLGLMHAANIDPFTATYEEYGDGFDVMGNAYFSSTQDLNTGYKHDIGWLPATHVLTLDAAAAGGVNTALTNAPSSAVVASSAVTFVLGASDRGGAPADKPAFLGVRIANASAPDGGRLADQTAYLTMRGRSYGGSTAVTAQVMPFTPSFVGVSLLVDFAPLTSTQVDGGLPVGSSAIVDNTAPGGSRLLLESLALAAYPVGSAAATDALVTLRATFLTAAGARMGTGPGCVYAAAGGPACELSAPLAAATALTVPAAGSLINVTAAFSAASRAAVWAVSLDAAALGAAAVRAVTADSCALAPAAAVFLAVYAELPLAELLTAGSPPRVGFAVASAGAIAAGCKTLTFLAYAAAPVYLVASLPAAAVPADAVGGVYPSLALQIGVPASEPATLDATASGACPPAAFLSAASTCVPCPARALAPESAVPTDASACACAPGYYLSAGACVGCANNTFKPLRGSAADLCWPCPAGSVSAGAADRCTALAGLSEQCDRFAVVGSAFDHAYTLAPETRGTAAPRYIADDDASAVLGYFPCLQSWFLVSPADSSDACWLSPLATYATTALYPQLWSPSVWGGAPTAAATCTLSNAVCPAGSGRTASNFSCAACVGNTFSASAGVQACARCPANFVAVRSHTACACPQALTLASDGTCSLPPSVRIAVSAGDSDVAAGIAGNYSATTVALATGGSTTGYVRGCAGVATAAEPVLLPLPFPGEAGLTEWAVALGSDDGTGAFALRGRLALLPASNTSAAAVSADSTYPAYLRVAGGGIPPDATWSAFRPFPTHFSPATLSVSAQADACPLLGDGSRTPTATRSHSPSASSSPSLSVTPIVSSSASPSSTAAGSASSSASTTGSRSPSFSASPSPAASTSLSTSPSVLASPSASSSATPSPSTSSTRTPSATQSYGASPSQSSSTTASLSATPSPSGSVAASPSATASAAASGSVAASASPSASVSASSSASPTAAATPSASGSPSLSAAASSSSSSSVSASPAPSLSASPSGSLAASVTASTSPSATPTASGSASFIAPSGTPTASGSASQTRSRSVSTSPSATASPSSTPAPTISSSPSPSPTASATPVSASPAPSVTSTALPSALPSATSLAAVVVFDVAFAYPLGADASAQTVSSLAPSLLVFRCDVAAAAALALSAVRISAGTPGDSSISRAVILDAIRIANAGTACSGTRRLSGGSSRVLFASAGKFATLGTSVSLAGSSAASASAVVAAITAASFPLTAAAWTPLWGFSAATWVATFGAAPLSVVAGSVVAADAPAPDSAAGLSAGQQLGLGLGIGLALALVVIGVALYLACPGIFRTTRAAHTPPDGVAAAEDTTKQAEPEPGLGAEIA